MAAQTDWLIVVSEMTAVVVVVVVVVVEVAMQNLLFKRQNIKICQLISEVSNLKEWIYNVVIRIASRLIDISMQI